MRACINQSMHLRATTYFTRLSALEALLEDGEVISESQGFWNSGLVERLRTVCGMAAAALANTAGLVRSAGRAGPQQGVGTCRLAALSGGSQGWSRARAEIAEQLEADVKCVWQVSTVAATGYCTRPSIYLFCLASCMHQLV
jgi:hypothetical protein